MIAQRHHPPCFQNVQIECRFWVHGHAAHTQTNGVVWYLVRSVLQSNWTMACPLGSHGGDSPQRRKLDQKKVTLATLCHPRLLHAKQSHAQTRCVEKNWLRTRSLSSPFFGPIYAFMECLPPQALGFGVNQWGGPCHILLGLGLLGRDAVICLGPKDPDSSGSSASLAGHHWPRRPLEGPMHLP